MSKPTNAADRWHPQLHTIKAMVKLAEGVACKHLDSDNCRMDDEIEAARQALRIAGEKLQQVIDELTNESYRLVEKEPAAA